MFGFVVAGLSAALLLALGARPRFGRLGMRRLFVHLDASPAQEKAIRNSLCAMRDTMEPLKAQMKDARSELADLVRGDLNQDELQSWMRARSARLDELIPELSASFVRMVEVLDDRQRATFADWVQKGRFLAHPCAGRGSFGSCGHRFAHHGC